MDAKGLRWIGLVVSLLVVMAGCGPGTTPTQIPAGQETPSLPTATSAPAKTRINIVIPEDPPNFNPSIADSGYDALVMELVLLGLVDIDPYGQVFPELAAEVPTEANGDVVVHEDGTMDVIWKLRDDISWADGVPVTADDVIFTYEAIIDPETGLWVPGIDYIDSIEKTGDYSLIIHYNTIYPGYLTQFGGEQMAVWPAHYCDPEQGFVAWDCGRRPLSDGPYMLQEWVTGDHLTFVRNPNYYEPGKPYIDEILISIVPDDAVQKTMLIQGDADLMMWVSEAIIEEVKDEPSVRVSIAPAGRWVMRLWPNQAARGTIDPQSTPHPILADVRVRRAIRMAIDVDAISQNIFYGYARPIWTEFFREPYVCPIPRPAYDPTAAAALLEEAGWKDTDGDGVRECHGCPNAPEGYRMEMEFITYGEYGEPLELTHQLIAEQLRAVGIELQLTVMEGNVIWADYASGGIEQHGDFDIDLWDDGYAGIDPTDFLWELYHSSAAEPDAGWNVVRWSNPEFDALLEEAYTLDEARRKDIFCQMAQILEEELPCILLFSTINAEAYSARLEGVQSTANDIVTWNVANWKIVK